MSGPPSWSGSLKNNDSEDEDYNKNDDQVSFENLEPSASSSSVSGLIPHQGDESQDSERRHSNVYKGVRHLFLGSPDSRRKSAEDAYSSSDAMSKIGGRSNSTPPDEKAQQDLLDPESLSVIKQGLNEALGSDGKGSWLSVDDSSSFGPGSAVSQESASNEHLPVNVVNTSYRRHSTNTAAASASDHHLDEDFLPPPSPSSPARHLSTMVQSFSSRVASSSVRTPSPKPESKAAYPSSNKSIESLHEGFEIDPAHHSVFSMEDSVTTPSQVPPEDETAPSIPISPTAVLCGKSLMIFPATSKFRQKCYNFLKNPVIEPLVLILILLQTILLSYLNAHNVYDTDQKNFYYGWGRKWTDYALLIIFILYTAEAAIKIIAFGLFDDSQLIDDTTTRLSEARNSFFKLFQRNKRVASRKQPQVVLRTFTSLMSNYERQQARIERAYLRSSWNRVDFISVISFWISFILNITNVEMTSKMFVFRALFSLRILRLLNLTRGTSSVLRALKKAAPLLSNIAVFIAFFWMIFSIVGVQSFKSSLRRTCVWVDPEGIQPNYTTEQFCGSYYDPITYDVMPYVFTDGSQGPQAKGFTCPVQSYCVSDENPYDGTLSFDNVFNSLENVFVIMTANTFTDIMYEITDTDYLVASLYYMAGILVMYIWLMNLLIAVIASSFKLVQEEFYTDGRSTVTRMFHQIFTEDHTKYIQRTELGRWYYKTSWIWLLVILADLVIQCTATSESSQGHIDFIFRWQIWTTTALTAEIALRFGLYFPYWRAFWRSKGNLVDTALVIINIVILLPFVHDDTTLYEWMTIFQIVRFYRIAIAIPFTRDLWRKVLGNYKTVFNLSIFLFLCVFLCAIIASQLLRGVVPFDDDGEPLEVSFYDLANAFVGLYQLASTENWTAVMYPAIQYAPSLFLKICYGIFFVVWYIFSNFIILNLFIAVIMENLDVSPDVKRKMQIKAFVKEYAAKMSRTEYLTGSVKAVKALFRTGKNGQNHDPQTGDAVFDMLLEKHVVEEFLDEEVEARNETEIDTSWVGKITRKVKRKFLRSSNAENNPFLEEHELVDQSRAHPTNLAQDFLESQNERAKARQQYLDKNPNYDKSCYIFKPTNRYRQVCQSLVASSHGVRSNGVNPKPVTWYAVQAIMLAFTIALVTVACINTPLYYRNYVKSHGFTSNNWITYMDLFFVCAFSVEAAVKIIADGFWFTPNGYFRSSWNKIDFIVLCSLWINFISEAFFDGYVSRFVRCFQALRALRLLSVSAVAQQTFHSVVIVGITKILGAAILSLCVLVPYSVWGLNLFKGKLSQCNDGSLTYFSDCNGEYMNTPFNWDVVSPRAITEEYYDYDNFGKAFFIQFSIISYEGWIDILNAVMAITGKDTNPEPFTTRSYGVYFVLYNFLSSVFILSMFVAVIIRNYSETRGTAYLTDEQLAWYETEKILKMVKPSKRAPYRKPGTARNYLLQKTQDKKSWIHQTETILLTCLVILLCLEFYPAPSAEDAARMGLLMVVTLLYEAIMIAKLYALGIKLFIRRKWEVYALVTCTAAFTFTLIGVVSTWRDLFYNFQKLAVVGMLLLWIPKSSRLDQLFKTATASFGQLGNLLITWFILFLVFAIAFNQVFGLTRFGAEGKDNVNFRTIPKSLVLLFRMSFGEGWNELLYDYLVTPPLCVIGTGFTDSDCGSPAYAYILFTLWNILSMYIFVNMFISLIYENFSYVFHRSSSDITKEDIHMFKQCWLRFDPDGTGYIPTKDLGKLLSISEGYFSIGIYRGKHSVKSILHDAKMEFDPSDPYDYDVNALNAALKGISGGFYRQKRQQFDIFCAQAMIEAHPTKGIAFNSLLRQFPLYKSMDHKRCLKLDDYLKRKMLMQKIEVRLLKSKLVGFLNMVYDRKSFMEKVPPNPFQGAYIIPELRHPRPINTSVLPKISVSNTDYLGTTGPETPIDNIYESNSSIQQSPAHGNLVRKASVSTTSTQYLGVKTRAPRRLSSGSGELASPINLSPWMGSSTPPKIETSGLSPVSIPSINIQSPSELDLTNTTNPPSTNPGGGGLAVVTTAPAASSGATSLNSPDPSPLESTNTNKTAETSPNDDEKV